MGEIIGGRERVRVLPCHFSIGRKRPVNLLESRRKRWILTFDVGDLPDRSITPEFLGARYENSAGMPRGHCAVRNRGAGDLVVHPRLGTAGVSQYRCNRYRRRGHWSEWP